MFGLAFREERKQVVMELMASCILFPGRKANWAGSMRECVVIAVPRR